ncbi:MAG: GIY-YIG nuclease family protein [Methylococcaceae bacterium]
MKQIYIIEDSAGHKKIGISSNIKQRVIQLNTANPVGIISVMTSEFMQNARIVEKQLHEANKKNRLNGEWFKEIVDFCGVEFSYLSIDVAKDAFVIFQDSLIEIAKDRELTGETKSVLFFLMGNLEFENYITIKQVEIAKQLEMQKTHVSRAIKLLVNKEIILKVKEGTTTGYKLNPTYGWKGKVENMEKAKARMAEDKIIDFQSAREIRDLPDVGIRADDIPY